MLRTGLPGAFSLARASRGQHYHSCRPLSFVSRARLLHAACSRNDSSPHWLTSGSETERPPRPAPAISTRYAPLVPGSGPSWCFAFRLRYARFPGRARTRRTHPRRGPYGAHPGHARRPRCARPSRARPRRPGRARPRVLAPCSAIPCRAHPRRTCPHRAHPQPCSQPPCSPPAELAPGRAYRDPSRAHPLPCLPRAYRDPSLAHPRRARLRRNRPRPCSPPRACPGGAALSPPWSHPYAQA